MLDTPDIMGKIKEIAAEDAAISDTTAEDTAIPPEEGAFNAIARIECELAPNSVVQFTEKSKWRGCIGIIVEVVELKGGTSDNNKIKTYLVGVPTFRGSAAYTYAPRDEMAYIGKAKIPIRPFDQPEKIEIGSVNSTNASIAEGRHSDERSDERSNYYEKLYQEHLKLEMQELAERRQRKTEETRNFEESQEKRNQKKEAEIEHVAEILDMLSQKTKRKHR